MWYSSGTVSVTSGGTTVTGSGTAFLANVRIGDGITIQGSTALHEVIGIASDTSLTIRPAYGGTTGTGRQYATVPVLGYDKDLSDAFNDIRLNFGSTLSALQPWAYAATAAAALNELGVQPWAYAATADAALDDLGVQPWAYASTADAALDDLGVQPWAYASTADAALDDLGFSGVGKSVATGNAGSGRAALELGTAAVADLLPGIHSDLDRRVLRSGDYGIGATKPTYNTPDTYQQGWMIGTGGIPGWASSVTWVNNQAGAGFTASRLSLAYQLGRAAFRMGNPGAGTWYEFRHSGNTTVDSNGFVKSASPIIKLHKDRIETGEKAAGALFTRIGPGHYEISNCNGLRLGDGWYLETPHDRNGNKYFNVEWHQAVEPNSDNGVLEEPAGITLTIRCYERVWNPQAGLYDNGEPVDVPDGRWIDLRMNEVREEESEPIEVE